ncbi:MAG: hypothetical protein AAEJ52_03285, partial [Myxococcota bacterium]
MQGAVTGGVRSRSIIGRRLAVALALAGAVASRAGVATAEPAKPGSEPGQKSSAELVIEHADGARSDDRTRSAA